ncbi:MAG: hypothetical protein ACK518_00440 [bacterium]|jgi:hypothetical protein
MEVVFWIAGFGALGGVVGILIGLIPIMNVEFWLGLFFMAKLGIPRECSIALIVGFVSAYRIISERRASTGTLPDRRFVCSNVGKLFDIRYDVAIWGTICMLVIAVIFSSFKIPQAYYYVVVGVMALFAILQGNIINNLIVAAGGVIAAIACLNIGTTSELAFGQGITLMSNCWFVIPFLVSKYVSSSKPLWAHRKNV